MYVVHHHYLVVDVAVVRDPEGNEISYGFHLHHCQRYMPERMETMLAYIPLSNTYAFERRCDLNSTLGII